MIKTLVVGLWACLITLAAAYGVQRVMLAKANAPPQIASSTLEARKSKEINVPVIRDGVIKGYVVAQFSYVVDLAVAKKLTVDPDPFVVDEAFRYLFDDDKIDFTHMEKIDLDKMLQTLIARANARTKSAVIQDMGVIECNFVLNAEAKTNLGTKLKP
jgi:hypothetical protein